jgi:hypothetical protein
VELLMIDFSSSSYFQFVLSIDELPWARAWLNPADSRRCDALIVFVARADDIRPALGFRFLESKGRRDVEPLPMRPEAGLAASAMRQVQETMRAFESARYSGESSLVDDLRFAVLMQQVYSIVLRQLYPIRYEDTDKQFALDLLSRFSSRQHEGLNVSVDGLVVITQTDADVPGELVCLDDDGSMYGRKWPIYALRIGSSAVSRLFSGSGAERPTQHQLHRSLSVAPVAPVVEIPAEPPRTDIAGSTDTETALPALAAAGSPDALYGASSVEKSGAQKTHGPIARPALSDSVEAEVARQVSDLLAACRSRGFRVTDSDGEPWRVGPSLISAPFSLEFGESLRPIENALTDLAREVGVSTLEVRNHPRLAGHLEFLIARASRDFPKIPTESAPLFDGLSQSYLGLHLGQEIDGSPFVSFVSSWPHMLVGGTSGSGKTTFLRSILVQLAHLSQQQLQTIVIDGKGEVDFIGLLPNSLFPPEFPEVVLGQDEVMNVLDWIVEYEVPRRKSQIVELARQSSSPVSRTGARGRYTAFLSGTEPLLFPPLIVVIDEFAEIALSQRKSGFEERVRSIAQAGRSQLVHLILATQRPDARIVEGAIKSNLDTRVALRLPTSHDSMTILGGGGAEKLLGHGDLIFQNSSTPPKRLQGYSA